ncbi:MAG: flavin reductase family protein [Bacillota bacterium]|nr:flavin reductase family protein [Candidatus Fermentithermobacillaceae bacterium]
MGEQSKRLLSPGPLLCPVPAVLVTCGDIDAEKNAITLAWVGVASSEPPCVTIGVRPTRYSFGLIQRYGDFVVNVPGMDQVGVLKYCGSVSGRSEDKFKAAGITPVPAEKTRAPLVLEFPLNLECKVKSRVSLGSHDLFIGEIVAVHADNRVLTGGEVDPAKVAPLSYFRGKYYRLGEPV